MDSRILLFIYILGLALLAGITALLTRARPQRIKFHPGPNTIHLDSIDDYISYYRQEMKQSQQDL